MDKSELDPTCLGYPYARDRGFIRMRHKAKVIAEVSPLSNFAKRFYRAIKFEWWKQIWFLMDPKAAHLATIADEAQRELTLAQDKEQSSAHAEAPLSPSDTDAFFRVLHPTEQSHVNSYDRRWPGEAWQLHQDPLSGFEGKSNPWALQA